MKHVLQSILKKGIFLKTAAITSMLLFCFGVGVQNVTAQITIFSEDFESADTDEPVHTELTGWNSEIVEGSEVFEIGSFSGNQFATVSSFGAGGEVDVYLITPAIDLSGSASPELTFDVQKRFFDDNVLRVYISEDYDGTNFGSATFTEVTSSLNIPTQDSFNGTDALDLSSYSGEITIAFRYTVEDPDNTTTLRIDNVLVSSIDPVSIASSDFKFDDSFEDFDGDADPENWLTSDVGSDASSWLGQNTGSSTGGGKYSYGNSSSSDRSIGFLPTGNRSINADIVFQNNTGSTITEFQVLYDAEHWRNAPTGRTNGWTVNWLLEGVDQGELEDLTYLFEPRSSDGTGAASPGPWESVSRSITVQGVTIEDGETITLRFFGDNGTGGGARQGVGINNFSFRTGSEIEAIGASEPIVSSTTVNQRTQTSANFSSSVTDDGGAEVTDRGFVYSVTSENDEPEIGGTGVTKVDVGTGTGSFSQVVSGLDVDTGYSARSFATNSEGTVYSSVVSFSTLEEGVLFLETFGTQGGSIAVASYTDYDNPSFTFEGDTDIRSTLSSSGYSGASGGANVFYSTAGGGERNLTISGIDLEEYSLFDLSFGMNSGANQGLTVEYSLDGETFTEIEYSNPETSGWKLVEISNVFIPNTDDLTLRFSSDENSYRLDDISLKATGFGVQLTGTEGFRMLSAPVETSLEDFLSPIWTQGAAGADFGSGSPNVFTWDIGDGEWSAVTDLTSTNVTAGTGVLVYVFDKDDHDDEESNVWPKTLSVSGAENAAGASPSVNSSGEGFTLLGNPFASPIAFGDLTTEELTGTIYVWDANDETGDGGGDTDDGDVGAGSWKTWSSSGGDITDGILRPFQGFFVQNVESPEETPSVTFPESAKTTGGTFLGKENQQERKIVRLEMTGQNMRNSAWLSFSDAGSTESQVRGDALKLEPLSSNFAQLATEKGGTLFDISHLPVMDEEYSIPVHISASKSGSFTLTATDFELPENFELTFHDHASGTSLPLTADFSYTVELAQAAKSAELSPLERVKQGPVVAKASEEPLYSISVASTQGVNISEPGTRPERVALNQNYPNPFNPVTVINYELPSDAHVTLDVFDMTGRRVATLVNSQMSAGVHDVTFDASSLSSGVYIYRLTADGMSLTRKLTLIK